MQYRAGDFGGFLWGGRGSLGFALVLVGLCGVLTGLALLAGLAVRVLLALLAVLARRATLPSLGMLWCWCRVGVVLSASALLASPLSTSAPLTRPLLVIRVGPALPGSRLGRATLRLSRRARIGG